MIRAHLRWWAAVSVAAMALGACTSTAGGSAEMRTTISRDVDDEGQQSDSWLSDATRGLLHTRIFAPLGVDITVRPQDPGEVATPYETVLGQLRPSAPTGFSWPVAA